MKFFLRIIFTTIFLAFWSLTSLPNCSCITSMVATRIVGSDTCDMYSTGCSIQKTMTSDDWICLTKLLHLSLLHAGAVFYLLTDDTIVKVLIVGISCAYSGLASVYTVAIIITVCCVIVYSIAVYMTTRFQLVEQSNHKIDKQVQPDVIERVPSRMMKRAQSGNLQTELDGVVQVLAEKYKRRELSPDIGSVFPDYHQSQMQERKQLVNELRRLNRTLINTPIRGRSPAKRQQDDHEEKP